MEQVPIQKSSDKFVCEKCDYSTSRKSQYHRHLETDKHKFLQNPTPSESSIKTHKCECGKIYKHSSTLYAHKKICKYNDNQTSNNDLINYLIKENSELKKEQTDIKQLILELVKNGVTNNKINNSHNTTNSHNKAFNLNFFLNETCKNAINLNDFVDSVKLQLGDLISVGDLGYVDGVSNIIVKKLNDMDETERPIHCTDKKRETMYIKDDGKWDKDEDNIKLKNAITRIADKNIKLLPQYREKCPDYDNAYSKASDKYEKLMIEVMTYEDEKKDKIVKNISKATIIKEK